MHIKKLFMTTLRKSTLMIKTTLPKERMLEKAALCIAVALALTGCATTHTLTLEQCQANDWQAIGFADGAVGRSGAYFSHHIDNCAPVAGSTPNKIAWEQGRQEGLKEFCTELNAYKLGREGYDWRPVCPLENIEKLEDAYSEGRYYYLRQRDMQYLTSPYFGPYHRHPLRPGPWHW